MLLSRFKRILKTMQTQYLSFNDFLADVSIKYEHQKDTPGHWRYGQMYFNLLSDARPDISDRIKGSSLDPYYKDVVAGVTHAFVESNW